DLWDVCLVQCFGGYPAIHFSRCTNQLRVPHSSRLLRRVGSKPSADLWHGYHCFALDLQESLLLFIDYYGSAFAECIITKTTPVPLFGLPHQSPLLRIAMHVAKLLDAFLLTPEIEILKRTCRTCLASWHFDCLTPWISTRLDIHCGLRYTDEVRFLR